MTPVRARRPYAVYRPPPDWTGITDGFDANCSCTWARGPDPAQPSRSVYQVKRPDRACDHQDHAAAALARRTELWEG